MAETSTKFKVGDRVVRPKLVYDPKSPLLHGAIAEIYSTTSKFGSYPELYAVRWDGRKTIERGFLPHGLSLEE